MDGERPYIIQCPSQIRFSPDSVSPSTVFRCRLVAGHYPETNHSTNRCEDDAEPLYLPNGNLLEPAPSVTFRLDWRGNDGVVMRRWPKKDGKS